MRAHVSDRPRWRAWAAATLVGLAAIGASLTSPQLRHQWLVSFVRQPTPYTVLAFAAPDNLPVQTTPRWHISVSFVIGNNEGRPVHYRWVLASGSKSALTPIRTGSRLVAAGKEWTVKTTFVPKCPGRDCAIEVSLPAQHEHIDFLVTRAHDRR